ncbi:maestro heat-like repeat-containing protein family member 7 isoform 2-T5 [Leptosomus discolor]
MLPAGVRCKVNCLLDTLVSNNLVKWMKNTEVPEAVRDPTKGPASSLPAERDISWLPVYKKEKERMDFIRNFVSSPGKTLEAMDTMLNTLVLNCSASKVNEELQNIFEMLLPFTTSEREAVRERTVRRIKVLSDFLANNSTLKAWLYFGTEMCDNVCYPEIRIKILGQLLGRLTLFQFSKEETSCPASDALFCLNIFMQKQESRSMLKAKAPKLHWEDKTISLLRAEGTRDLEFGKYLHPSERTDVVLVAIEALADSGIFVKEAREMLGAVMRDPDFWLVDVPQLMKCIHKNLKHINRESARQSLQPLLLLLADRYPMQVVVSLLKLSPPEDSTDVATWEMLFSVPQTLENILKELLSKLQDTELRSLVPSAAEDAFIPRLASEDVADPSRLESHQRHPSLATISLFLRSLIALSGRPDMARKMQVLLPPVMEVLQDGDADIKREVLVVFRNVMGHLERKEASPIALQLAERLPPLFNEESSQTRELSISLFRDVLETVVGDDRRRMKKKAQRGLLPLFFHVHDGDDTVAKVSGEALIVAAELLKWKQLKHLTQTEQTWRIGECLLVQKRSRAEEYLNRSLPYLQDAQAALREAAVRFIGLAARHLRDQSKEKRAEICSALKPLEEDVEPSVCSLALQTVLIVSSPRKQPASGWTRVLCCWPCKAREG